MLALKMFLSLVTLTIASDLIFQILSLEKCELCYLSVLDGTFYFIIIPFFLHILEEIFQV